MLAFDLNLEPPTRQQIEAEQQRLKTLRTHYLWRGLISDGLHALLLLLLYFGNLLSGTAFIVVALFGSIIAIVLATGTRPELAGSDLLALLVIMLCSAGAVSGITVVYFGESLLGGLFAGLVTGSITATGSLLGRKIMRVLTALEALQLITEDHPAHRELLGLCRNHPELAAYRLQARQLLRPFLTFGELQAMQSWLAGSRSDHHPAPPC